LRICGGGNLRHVNAAHEFRGGFPVFLSGASGLEER